MNNQIKNAGKHLENIEEFLNHNLNLGYLKSDMPIIELLQFIKNIKENYIPSIKDIENLSLRNKSLFICKNVEKCANQKWDSILQIMSCDYEDGEQCQYSL